MLLDEDEVHAKRSQQNGGQAPVVREVVKLDAWDSEVVEGVAWVWPRDVDLT